MSREDEERTAFITVDGLFCYVSMSYGLKNALPTFVCAMHKTFKDLIRDLIEVYIDNIIAKIKSHSSLLDNLTIVLDMHNVEPGQVYVRGLCWKAAWLPCFASANRGQPREDKGDQSDASTRMRQGCPEAHVMLGHAQPVYL
jgi:hypothetical protein